MTAAFNPGKVEVETEIKAIQPVRDPEPIVTVIVVSFNTRDITLEALRSFREQTTVPYQLIVIDNDSKDGSAEAIAEAHPDVMLIASPENFGFAKANNIAAEHARGKYLLLLNPDTITLDGAVDKLVAFAERTPEALIWGGKTLFPDMRLNPGSCWQRMTLWNIFCRTFGLAAAFPGSPIFNAEAYGGWKRDTEARVDIVAGCFIMLPLEIWKTLDGFSPAYFMYGDESDLCHRAIKQCGAKPRVTPEAVIVHYAGASEKVRADKLVRLINAKMTLIRHHFPALSRPLGLFLYRREAWFKGLIYGLLARVTGRDSLKASAEVWSEIWNRRAEWWAGYPDA